MLYDKAWNKSFDYSLDGLRKAFSKEVRFDEFPW